MARRTMLMLAAAASLVLGGVAQAAPVAGAGPMAAAAPDPAAARKIALAARYFKAIHYDALVKNIVSGMMPMMQEAVGKSSELNDQQQAALKEATSEAMDAMMNSFIPKMEARILPIMADVYTEEELTQLVAFYESPVGQSIMEKAPRMTPLMMASIKDEMPAILEDAKADIMRRFCSKTDCKAMKSGAGTAAGRSRGKSS